MTVTTHEPRFVIIDGEPFALAQEKGKLAWNPLQVPTQEGDPTSPRQFHWNNWSSGMGDSRGIFDGAVEYAEAFLGARGRILPPPAISKIETNHAADIVAILEVTNPATRLVTVGGTSLVETDSSHAVQATRTLAATATDAVLWGDIVAIAEGDSQDFQYRTTAPAIATNSLSKKARAFGISGSDLVRGTSYNWSRCSAANFYTVDNWSADYPIGDPTGNINKVFGFNRFDYVLKDEGFYTFDQDQSKEVNVLEDLRAWKSSENRNWFPWHDQIMLCTNAGLYRFITQGAGRTTGAEEIETNEASELRGYITAGASFGKWAYVALWDGTTTRICLARKARNGDVTALSGAPVTIVSVLDKFTGICRAMKLSSISGAMRLYYGQPTGDLRHFGVGRDGIPASYSAGTGESIATALVRFAPNDFGSPETMKYLRSIVAITRALGAVTPNLVFKAALDGGSANAVGSAVLSAGVTSTRSETFFTRATNDSGRVMQLTAEIALGAGTPEIRDVFLNYEERPLMTAGYMAQVLFRDQVSAGSFASQKDAIGQRQFLEALLDGAPKLITDPEGNSYAAGISRYQGQTDYVMEGNPEMSAQILIRKLDYS